MFTKNHFMVIGVIFLLYFVFVVRQNNQKEGFVKYYQAPDQAEQDIRAENNDKSGKSDQFVPNSRVNLEKTLVALGQKHLQEVTLLAQQKDSAHDGVIDVLELRNALNESFIPDMNIVAKELATNSDYSLSGNPQDVVVRQSSIGDNKLVTATIEIHDTSLVLWTGYTTTVQITFWLAGPAKRVLLVSANIMQKNVDDDASGPAYNDKAKNDASEELLSKFHLVYPWDTSEQSNGLAISEQEKNEILANRNAKATEDNFYCFGVVGVSPGDGISREECTRRGGVVDAPVYDSTSCQYYMSNGNYPNARGGEKYGYCEGPLGAVQTSFSRWDPNPAYAPLCYNCKAGVALNGKEGGLGPCCEDQKANLTEYNLLTPDYAFPGDMFDRRQFADNFKARGLSWHRFGKEYEENLRKGV